SPIPEYLYIDYIDGFYPCYLKDDIPRRLAIDQGEKWSEESESDFPTPPAIGLTKVIWPEPDWWTLSVSGIWKYREGTLSSINACVTSAKAGQAGLVQESFESTEGHVDDQESILF